jgi:hypothetical protein
MVEWWVSDELESVSKEEVLPQLKHSSSIRLEGRWKPRKPSVGITGVPAEIRTDTSRIQICHYTNLFSRLLCGTWMNIYSILLLRMQNEIRQELRDRRIHGTFVITTMLCNFAVLLRVLEVACYSFSLQTDYRGSFSWFYPITPDKF